MIVFKNGQTLSEASFPFSRTSPLEFTPQWMRDALGDSRVRLTYPKDPFLSSAVLDWLIRSRDGFWFESALPPSGVLEEAKRLVDALPRLSSSRRMLQIVFFYEGNTELLFDRVDTLLFALGGSSSSWRLAADVTEKVDRFFNACGQERISFELRLDGTVKREFNWHVDEYHREAGQFSSLTGIISYSEMTTAYARQFANIHAQSLVTLLKNSPNSQLARDEFQERILSKTQIIRPHPGVLAVHTGNPGPRHPAIHTPSLNLKGEWRPIVLCDSNISFRPKDMDFSANYVLEKFKEAAFNEACARLARMKVC